VTVGELIELLQTFPSDLIVGANEPSVRVELGTYVNSDKKFIRIEMEHE
jgi:hypothetical protein